MYRYFHHFAVLMIILLLVTKYYGGDKVTWGLIQRVRRADRFFQEWICGQVYPFLLPGEIKRWIETNKNYLGFSQQDQLPVSLTAYNARMITHEIQSWIISRIKQYQCFSIFSFFIFTLIQIFSSRARRKNIRFVNSNISPSNILSQPKKKKKEVNTYLISHASSIKFLIWKRLRVRGSTFFLSSADRALDPLVLFSKQCIHQEQTTQYWSATSVH